MVGLQGSLLPHPEVILDSNDFCRRREAVKKSNCGALDVDGLRERSREKTKRPRSARSTQVERALLCTLLAGRCQFSIFSQLPAEEGRAMAQPAPGWCDLLLRKPPIDCCVSQTRIFDMKRSNVSRFRSMRPFLIDSVPIIR